MVVQPSRLAGGISVTPSEIWPMQCGSTASAIRFLEDGQVGLVAAGLLGRDDHVELHDELSDCRREETVVDIGDDGNPVPAFQNP
jgi:hypothetical protein